MAFCCSYIVVAIVNPPESIKHKSIVECVCCKISSSSGGGSGSSSSSLIGEVIKGCSLGEKFK